MLKIRYLFSNAKTTIAVLKRIFEYIRIFEYFLPNIDIHSIRGHFQNLNIIRIFKYFGTNIQKQFSGNILEFLRNRDKIWRNFCILGDDPKFLLMSVNMCITLIL